MDNAAFALMALIAMEIVLGIDNIVFIALLTSRLPKHQQALGRNLGLGLALFSRLALLWLLVLLTDESNTFFSGAMVTLPAEIAGITLEKAAQEVSLRDLILFIGGLFLIWKSVHEMHEEMEGVETKESAGPQGNLASILVQIALLDIVFSLDSVITAVGMAEDIRIMAAAIVVAVIVMLLFAKKISSFIADNPTLKMLALSFMILIGVVLVSDSLGLHISKGYIYFAMAFSMIVEMLNIRIRKVDRVSIGGPADEVQSGELAAEPVAEDGQP